MIYFMPICEADQMETQYRSWLPQLPSARQKKLLRYRFAKDRWLCAAAYMLLLHALQNEYGITEEQVKMEVEESGKPYLASHPHIFFNLSHCDIGVACGTGNAPIGIDVETVRKIDNNVIRRVCSASEQDMLKQSPNPDLLFAVMWTLKESWLKAKGYGIDYSLDKVNTKKLFLNNYQICQEGYVARTYIITREAVLSACTPDTLRNERPIVSIITPDHLRGGIS